MEDNCETIVRIKGTLLGQPVDVVIGEEPAPEQPGEVDPDQPSNVGMEATAEGEVLKPGEEVAPDPDSPPPAVAGNSEQL